MTLAAKVVVLAAVVMALALAVATVVTLVGPQGPRAMARSFHLLSTPRANSSRILKVTQRLRTSWMAL
jgi:hypothetical protein